jgi:sulfite reductase (ferredoxin)
VHTLGIDDFRTLTEKYFGQKIEPWKPLPEWEYIDWMGWHEQGDGNFMLGVNIEQGRVRDTPEARIKSGLRNLVDTYPNIGMILTPSQSVVLRNITPEQKENVETLLKFHGFKMIEEVDRITRKSIACPAYPLCGLAITEAERVQPHINERLVNLMDSMGLGDLEFVTRTTGCPNGCARPYMAEMALVGSGPNMYQVWLGGHPAQGERTAEAVPSLFKMNLNDLEKTFEPIFCMYKMQREEEHEAFGTFCHRVGNPAIEEYIKDYVPGSHASMPDPFNVPEVVTDASVGITADLLATLESAAGPRGLSAETLLDTLVREALEDDAPEDDAPEESA